MSLNFYTLWAINGPLDEGHLCSQLDDMRRWGFDGIHGEEISTILPLLFFPGDGHAAARVRFWEMLTNLFGDAFLTPLDSWCKAHDKRFTAHIKGEEHPLFQVPIGRTRRRIPARLPGISSRSESARFPIR